MVRAKPTDNGDDEPQAKVARFVEQEVEGVPMRREDDELKDQSSEDEDMDSDADSDTNSDTDFDDFEETEDEEEVAVPMDAEDVVPVVDEQEMANLYGQVHSNAINIVTNRAHSNASSRSAGTVLKRVGVDDVMTQVMRLWKQVDKAVDNARNIELWPFVFEAVQHLWIIGRLKPQNLYDITLLPDNFVNDYEEALEILMNEKLVPPIDPTEDQEVMARRASYETRRVKMLQAKALKFHNMNGNRPGWLHEFGHLFPVQATYDMIAYLVVAMPRFSFDFQKNMKENQVWHPEWDEVNPGGRRLMEICFIMDASIREEFIELVKAKRRVYRELSPEEIQTVTNLFDTMNSVFNWNFEYFLIDNAAHLKKKREIKKFIRSGQFEQNVQHYEKIIAEADQAYEQLQTMMGKH